mmetsp:Transcript_28975/g.60489  ORF Transcript_28975/g.60489 Transcript_28975/m.60489 type:complete len:285 (+) Transcript_28975:1740-2594(+)
MRSRPTTNRPFRPSHGLRQESVRLTTQLSSHIDSPVRNEGRPRRRRSPGTPKRGISPMRSQKRRIRHGHWRKLHRSTARVIRHGIAHRPAVEIRLPGRVAAAAPSLEVAAGTSHDGRYLVNGRELVWLGTGREGSARESWAHGAVGVDGRLWCWEGAVVEGVDLAVAASFGLFLGGGGTFGWYSVGRRHTGWHHGLVSWGVGGHWGHTWEVVEKLVGSWLLLLLLLLLIFLAHQTNAVAGRFYSTTGRGTAGFPGGGRPVRVFGIAGGRVRDALAGEGAATHTL